MDLFEVKLKYQTLGVDKPVKHSDTYIIEAYNYTDAEAKINEIIEQYGFMSAEIKGMKPVKYFDIFENPTASDGFWYTAKVEMIVVNENGEEKRLKEIVLVNATDIFEASKRTRDELKNNDCESIAVQKTNIVEVIRK